MPSYRDVVLGTPRKEQGLSASPVPVGQSPGSELAVHSSVTLPSSLPRAPTPNRDAGFTAPGHRFCLRLRGCIVCHPHWGHSTATCLGRDCPCSSRGVFPPLCLSGPGHPPCLPARPPKHLQVARSDPSVTWSPPPSALPHTNGLRRQGLGSNQGSGLGLPPIGHFPGPHPPSVLRGPGALQPESFTSCLPFSPSPRSVAARGIRGLCK